MDIGMFKDMYVLNSNVLKAYYDVISYIIRLKYLTLITIIVKNIKIR